MDDTPPQLRGGDGDATATGGCANPHFCTSDHQLKPVLLVVFVVAAVWWTCGLLLGAWLTWRAVLCRDNHHNLARLETDTVAETVLSDDDLEKDYRHASTVELEQEEDEDEREDASSSSR